MDVAKAQPKLVLNFTLEIGSAFRVPLRPVMNAQKASSFVLAPVGQKKNEVLGC